MNIAVNTRMLQKGKLEGVGRFSYEILKRIVHEHPEHEFFFLFDRPFDKDFEFADNVHAVYAGPSTRHPFLYVLWFEYTIPKLLKALNADLFISMDGHLSLRTKVKSITAIHDLNFEHHPQYLPWLLRKYYTFFFPKFAKKAERIITVSNFCKEDISKTYKVKKDKIDVVYNASSNDFNPISDVRKAEIKLEFSDNQPYFSFLGGLYPRKNLQNMLLAFDEFKKATNLPYKFILMGNREVMGKESLTNVYNGLKFKNDVLFAGRIEPSSKASEIIAASNAFVFVSNFEGFGIPLLEAMHCDVPIICGDSSAMPEVTGKASLKVDSSDVRAISKAMEKICTDTMISETLITKGQKQREKFNWDKSAEAFWACIQKEIKQ